MTESCRIGFLSGSCGPVTKGREFRCCLACSGSGGRPVLCGANHNALRTLTQTLTCTYMHIDAQPHAHTQALRRSLTNAEGRLAEG